ncbi:MAG TPA: SIMPL domain-containing protein, partial [Gemmatimonadales bacterium]|nr:SIMPL domain-containing protein [Gemmatimonadales bacterium]
MNRTPLFVALIGALGLVLAGGAIGRGFRDARMAERYVSVKGVSEREVKADLALWPIPFVAANDDLALAQEQIVRSSERIKAFLVRQALDTAQAQLQTLRVTDRQANPYQTQEGGRRFILRQTLIVRSTDPDKVLAASQRVGELVQGGVVLSSGEEYGPGGPTFLFTKLNDIKPAMIA